MAVKGHWLAVACPKSNSLTVVDLKLNKVAGNIPLAGTGPCILFCSKAANPYVYALYNLTNGRTGQEVFQVDCDKLSLRNRCFLQGVNARDVRHTVMSVDGKWILSDARGSGSIQPERGFKASTKSFSASRTYSTFIRISELSGRIRRAAIGRSEKCCTLWIEASATAVVGVNVANGFGEPARKFEGSPVAIHPSCDLVVSAKDGALTHSRSPPAMRTRP